MRLEEFGNICGTNFCDLGPKSQKFVPQKLMPLRYTNLKVEWRKISDRAKLGSGLALVKEPNWYKHINGIYLTSIKIRSLYSSLLTPLESNLLPLIFAPLIDLLFFAPLIHLKGSFKELNFCGINSAQFFKFR